MALPAALREGYALLGRRDDLTRHQDPLVPPGGLHLDDALGGLLHRDGVQDHSWIHARGRTPGDLDALRADLPGPRVC